MKSVQQIDSDVFTAIAHPVRRQILDMLAAGDLPVSGIAAPFAATRPAISQHLRVLLDAGLVSEQRFGRERVYRLQPDKLAEAQRWLNKYERFWRDKLAKLGDLLEQEE